MLGKHDDWSMLWEDIASYFSPNACGTCPHIMHCYAIPSPSLRDAFLHFLRGYLIYILYAGRSYANFILLSSLDRKAAFSCSWPSFSLSQFYTPSNIAMHQPFPLLDLTSFMWRDARLHSPPCCRCSCLLLLPAPCKPLHPYTPLLTVSIWTTHVSTTPFWLFKLLKFGPALFGVPPTPFELPDYSYLEISCLDHLILDYL